MGGCGDDDDETVPPTNTPDAGTGDAGTGDAGTGDGGTGDAGTPPTADDTDLAVVRFNTDGTLDTAFGTNGIAKVDLSTGTANARDTLWSMDKDASNRLVLFGNRKADPNRSDLDYAVARLTADGTLDTTFGTNGIYSLNISNLSEQARHGLVQPDGKIIASGYLPQPTGVGAQSSNRILLQRLDDAGKLDPTFGSKGVVNSAPFKSSDPDNVEWGLVEAYAAGYQSGSYVTTGYGRVAPSGTVDLLSFRYTSDGKLDSTWGTNGVYLLNLTGADDRGRDLTVLRDNRVFMVGSATPATSNIDALAVMLQSNGQPDTSFAAEGYKTYDFGRGDEAFFDVALSPDGAWVAAAGYSAVSATDSDAALLVRSTTSDTEFAGVVPLSETGNNRFWAIAFNPASTQVYAAGFINEGGDNHFAVARYNTNGTLDTTFGTNGIAKLNVVAAGTLETARSVVVQSDGKIVVAGIIEKR
ncbi:delta-60 repeat domain protein [Stigmatella aurantiaca DW4/3-1]|nr:delta-60 repeat domain protein [Stigmatella aurantiaca DW4/3-1]